MTPVSIIVEVPPNKATLDILDQGLDDYNARYAPTHHEEFVVALKTDSGEVKGGIYANTWSGMLFIKWLWIDDAYRRGGHGRRLMARAEEEGRNRGCTAVWLDTFEFQARPFYEKLGYTKWGTLDYPAGFSRHFLQKPL